MHALPDTRHWSTAMMDTADMLQAFSRHRGNAIVIPGRGGRHWVEISDKPNRDVPLGDPAMGGHASFGMGLALAQPGEKIVLFDSDGDVQMGMGILATIAEQQPRNFYHFMLDNECYATTGGQPVPNAPKLAYHDVARACGYARAYAYDDLEDFSVNVERILAEPGPVFVWLKVRPEIENKPIGSRARWRTRSQVQVVMDLKQELGIAT